MTGCAAVLTCKGAWELKLGLVNHRPRWFRCERRDTGVRVRGYEKTRSGAKQLALIRHFAGNALAAAQVEDGVQVSTAQIA